ncbi:MAG: hypothetical protein JXA52_09970 [Planctomycetes bacterium]|nr:hypothetical protein [Planctomycetota bacterium]
MSGCFLFGSSEPKDSEPRKSSARQQATRQASDADAEELFRRLDARFDQMVGLRDQIEVNRQKEEEILAKEFEELQQLRKEMEAWLDTRRSEAPQPRKIYTQRESRRTPEPVLPEPEDDSYIARLSELDDPGEIAIQPLDTTREAGQLSEPAPKANSVSPPPFTRTKKVAPRASTDSGITPPPFATSAKASIKAPAASAPAEPKYFTPPPVPLAEPESGLRVVEIKEAPLGRILNVEGKGDQQRILLDIGSNDGLLKGSLVSVGGIGAEYGIWQVDTLEKYSCRAHHLPGSAKRSPTSGTYVHVVRLDTSN